MRRIYLVSVVAGVLVLSLMVMGGLAEEAFRDRDRAEAQVKKFKRERAADRKLWQLAGEPDITVGKDMMIVCVTQGSRVVNGERVALDLEKRPAPGDAYRRVCRGVKNPEQEGPVG